MGRLYTHFLRGEKSWCIIYPLVFQGFYQVNIYKNNPKNAKYRKNNYVLFF